MKRLLIIALIAFFAWEGYKEFRGPHLAVALHDDAPVTSTPAGRGRPDQAPAQSFKCDGRIHCSQMTSCEEATWFLKNCPGVKMDGNHDGVPCEQQWCH